MSDEANAKLSKVILAVDLEGSSDTVGLDGVDTAWRTRVVGQNSRAGRVNLPKKKKDS